MTSTADPIGFFGKLNAFSNARTCAEIRITGPTAASKESASVSASSGAASLARRLTG